MSDHVAKVIRPTPRPIGAATEVRVRRRRRPANASYDAARTTDENARHWGLALTQSANAAARPGVRKLLRDRSRYEVANNSYASGVVRTLVNDVVGTGPRLQLMGSRGAEAVERSFADWWRRSGMTAKVRTLCASRYVDGEVFALLATNPKIGHQVQIDLRLIEADRVAMPTLGSPQMQDSDGIRYDNWGNPVSYTVLRDHPGATFMSSSVLAHDIEPAKRMIHHFRCERPGQSRGIPELAPALELFAMLRRYSLATLAAAEVAANFAGVIETQTGVGDGEQVEGEAFEPVDLDRRSFTTLPFGYTMRQMKAEQPTTTYGEFEKRILVQIGRCLNMPANVVMGDSSGYNYASGRLDHQVYAHSLRVEQEAIAQTVLDRIFHEWLREAVLVSDLLPLPVRTEAARTGTLPHTWFFDGREHVDPQKEAVAQGLRLQNRTTSLASEYARQGKDWEAELQQIAREEKRMEELGLTRQAPPQGAAAPANDNDEEADDGE